MTENATLLPAVDDRPDGMEILAFHRGKWTHVKWSQKLKGWHLTRGGAFIRDGGRAFAPLPPKPEGAAEFYDYE